MKKILWSLLPLLPVLMAGSCTREPLAQNDPVLGGKPVEVRFSVDLRQSLTKADAPASTELDNGAGTFQLYVAAFNKEDGSLAPTSKVGGTGFDPVASLSGGSADVTLTLAKGKDYKVVFFAQKADAYAVRFASGNEASFSFKDGLKANNAQLDAFCGSLDLSAAAESFSVTLKRPFAQLNVLVPADNVPAGQTAFRSAMTVKAPKGYDLFAGAATDAKAELTFAENAISAAPFGKFAAADKPYKWVGMNYVLAPADGKVEVTSFREAGMEKSVAPGSVPVKVNARTNMVGRVYGADADFSFNITVDPIFVDETENPLDSGDIPGGGDKPDDGDIPGDEPSATVKTLPYAEAFTTGIGDFTTDGVKVGDPGIAVWVQDNTYGMKATAYVANKDHASESWLTSPLIDLSGAIAPVLSFEHATNYFTDVAAAAKEATVWIREEGGEWKQLSPAYPKSLGWSFVPSGDVDLVGWKNKKVQIGFKYVSTTKAGTWEVKDFKVAEAESTPAPTPTPAPDNEPEPSGNVVTLTNAEIIAALSAGETTANSYKDVTIASASGTWTGNMNAKNDLTFIQIRNNKGAHLKSPTFSGNIAKIDLTVNGGTGSSVAARDFYAIASNTDLSQFGTDNYNANANKEKWEAVTKYGNVSSTASTTNVEQTVTLTFTGDTKSFMLVTANGAAYITSIKVYLK